MGNHGISSWEPWFKLIQSGEASGAIGGAFLCSCRVRETTHRSLTPLEKALARAGVSGWQSNEDKAPQLWRFE